MGRGGLVRELGEELNTVLRGRQSALDSVVPPLLFVVANLVWGLDVATAAALLAGGLITLVRVVRRQPLLYALGGVGGVVLAVALAKLFGRAEGYFVPGLVTGGLTVLACLGSVIIGRPLVALTSRVTRGWPWTWYRHERVLPAYNEVTLAWAAYFGVRVALQAILIQTENAALLAVFNIVSGWPATIALLVVTYIYGLWRLQHLRGPSVDEFKAAAAPPWQGQKRGF